MDEREVWTSPEGSTAELAYRGAVDDWFPESPGHRRPCVYHMVADGVVVKEILSMPVEPWSAYDAVMDTLIAEGWTPPTPSEAETAECEHGLSARLCAGPGHYPMDERY